MTAPGMTDERFVRRLEEMRRQRLDNGRCAGCGARPVSVPHEYCDECAHFVRCYGLTGINAKGPSET